MALKSAELNELIAQLELTNQAIVNVESTTTQIETMLKDLGLSEDTTALLMDAEASLDSAIKSATHLYANNNNSNNNHSTNANTNTNTSTITYDYPSQPLKARRPSIASNGSGGPQPPSDADYRREQRMVCQQQRYYRTVCL